MRCLETSVAAVITRFEEDSSPEYRQHFQCPKWEVVVPQFVLEPKVTGFAAERSAAATQRVQ
jgi:hypothetical protein